jgi:hypothetical protein
MKNSVLCQPLLGVNTPRSVKMVKKELNRKSMLSALAQILSVQVRFNPDFMRLAN